MRALGFHVAAIALFTVPAVALWWHVWSGHPSSTLTCGCGDPAQEVWFMAWPAWAIAHLHSLFFSGAVNVPDGANLLSNTSGTLIGVVLAPVTWLFGPVTSTNVALTLAPALSAWGCFAAIRPLVTWKPAAIPAGLVYGYSSAIVTSLAFGHVSVTFLVIPPLLFTTLHEIVIRQEHSARRDGLVLAALLVVQFLISPEVMVMCLLFAVVGLVAVMAVGWRQVRVRSGHALPALGLAVGRDRRVAGLPRLVRPGRAPGGDRGALRARADLGRAVLGGPRAGAVRGASPPSTSASGATSAATAHPPTMSAAGSRWSRWRRSSWRAGAASRGCSSS